MDNQSQWLSLGEDNQSVILVQQNSNLVHHQVKAIGESRMFETKFEPIRKIQRELKSNGSRCCSSTAAAAAERRST